MTVIERIEALERSVRVLMGLTASPNNSAVCVNVQCGAPVHPHWTGQVGIELPGDDPRSGNCQTCGRPGCNGPGCPCHGVKPGPAYPRGLPPV